MPMPSGGTVTNDFESESRLPYERPVMTVLGDLRSLTAGTAGAERDGGVGATKSKLSGAA